MDTDHTRTQVTLKSQKYAFGLERDCLCHNALSNSESAMQVGEGLATDNLPCLVLIWLELVKVESSRA